MSSQAAPDPTATTTVTTAQPQVVRVHLRAQNDDAAAAAAAPDTNTEGSQHVRWQACTVDNENLGRKSSKICCIYHKQREFGESSSESSESDGGSDRRNAYEKAPQQRKKGRHRKHGPCRHHDDAGPSE